MIKDAWTTGNENGRELAASAIATIREEESPNHLGRLVKSMIERGEFGAKEVGFFQAIAENLL